MFDPQDRIYAPVPVTMTPRRHDQSDNKKNTGRMTCVFSFRNKKKLSELLLETAATTGQNWQGIGCYDGNNDEYFNR